MDERLFKQNMVCDVMKALTIEPSEIHQCTLDKCPPGLFVSVAGGEIVLGFKAANGKSFTVETGNIFNGEERTTEVLPCFVVWL